MEGKDNGLWECFLAVLQIEKAAVKQEQIGRCQAYGAGSMSSLLRWAKICHMKINEVHWTAAEIADCHEPLIAGMRDGSFVIVGKSNQQVLLLFDPLLKKTAVKRWDSFQPLWTGTCYHLKKRFNLKEMGHSFNIYWFLSAIFRYKKYFGEVLMASFFLQLFGLVTPLFTQVIIDKVLIHHGIATLDVLALALLFAAIFQCMMSIARKYVETHTTNKIDMILGTRLFQHLLSLPLRYFEVRRVGDTLTRVSALSNIRNFFTGSSLTAFLDAFFSVVFFAVMFWYSTGLTIIALLPLPLYLLQNIAATPIYKKKIEAVWRTGACSNAFLVESVTGVQTVKALAVEPQFNHHWEKILADYVYTAFGNAKLNIILNASNSTIQNIMTFGILLVGGHMVMAGEFTIGQLIAFQMLARQAGEPLHRLSGLWQVCQQIMMAIHRLGDILDTPSEISGLHRQRLREVKGSIEFCKVSFTYDAESDPIIKDMDFKIEAGQKIGIVGRSGSGKSTVTKLIERLYLPVKGKVCIDGEDVMDIDPVWLRRHIGIVLQENFLFHGTIRDNIAFGRPSAAIDEVMMAAKMAGAHEFILELADGYDTLVGERGDTLSGGQRQRIAIARALLMDPKILIFDEATSALDYASENIIMQNLGKMSKGRTMIMIAHRLSTVRNCDKIFVVERGHLAEQGTHEELLAAKGIYFNLYQQQEG
jgi:subfamily B ATP-binding cassette protein HlyB/CyaB